MNLLFLDTETTDIENPRVVQLAYKHATTGEIVNAYFKPPVPISFGSMATHHITEAMIANKKAFEESPERERMLQLVQESIIVAHNAEFDIATLANEGVGVLRSIDTEQVARHVLVSDRYALQYLRYAFDLNVVAQAHDALGDVLVLEALFNYLTTVVREQYSLTLDEEVIQKMIELSDAPVLQSVFLFGKYKGKTFVEIMEQDKQYLEWLYASKIQNGIDTRDENLIHTLKHHLQIQDIVSE